MRTTNKDQAITTNKMMKASQHETSTVGMSANIPQQQPLQARSSNSGTSLKRSDISQSSSYLQGVDGSSDKPGFWTKSTSATQQLAPGQLTTAFAQKRETGANGTSKDLKRHPAARRANPENNSSLSKLQNSIASISQATGVSTRGRVKTGRPIGKAQRAVKDLRMPPQKQLSSTVTNSRAALKPTKQSNSEPKNMRTTRSKSKANNQSDTSLNEVTAEPAGHDLSLISNGQSDTGLGRNLEKLANVSINLKPAQKLDLEMSQSWAVEESKQLSPRSQMSTINGAITDKLANQSFQINDSTDSLLENPLTGVIKQFQNLRATAQSTGSEKPTIQQFLHKFEKEMQYLEDQYQAQQQAREEQMRQFENAYGTNPTKDYYTKQSKVASSGLNQASAEPGSSSQAAGANTSSAIGGDILMAQDTSTLGPMPHDNSNTSFVSGIHGPNNGGSYFSGVSEITSSEVYESFQFTQNSMVSFYPREVRRILNRRKTNNSANSIIADLKNLKPPKQKAKQNKTLSKMNSLAICQMNMMQILLQKISRKSKVIRKQEKIVNDNLKRKRIYLEKERFDLMSVLRKSIDGENNSQVTSKGGVNKSRTNGSDLTSLCPSTNGTKSGNDLPIASSLKGSSMARQFVEMNASLDDYQTRKQTRMHSGQENSLLVADSASQMGLSGRHLGMGESKTASTPEPPSNKAMKADQLQRAEQKVKQALDLSEIDSTFLNGASMRQSSLLTVTHKPRQGVEVSQIDQDTLGQEQIPTPSKSQSQMLHQQIKFESAQPLDSQISANDASNATQRPDQGVSGRKALATVAKRGKKKSSVLETANVGPAINPQGISVTQGSFAINAPITTDGPHVQTQHTADGKISLTLKVQDSHQTEGVSEAGNNSQRQSNSKGKRRKVTKAHTIQVTSSNAPLRANEKQEVQFEQKSDNQKKFSPVQQLGQENSQQVTINGVQAGAQPTFIHSHSLPENQYVGAAHMPVDAPYYGIQMMNGNQLEMEHDHFMMAEPHHRQGIFSEFMKQPSNVIGAQPHGAHQQSMVTPGQVTEMALARSQSVMLPQGNYFVDVAGEGLLDPMAAQNLAGTEMHGFVDPLLQHQGNAMQFAQGQAVIPSAQVVNRTGHRTGTIMDPFFDESPAELSSIEHTAFNGSYPQNQNNSSEAYGFQNGANPYELAKRRYMLESQKKLQQNPTEAVNSNPVGSDDRQKRDQNLGHEINFERVHNFVSPMGGLQQLSAQRTPQNKMMVDGHQAEGPHMVDGTNTPSHFMSGVDAGAQGLGRGNVAPHSLAFQQRIKQTQQVQQLSVSRLCVGDAMNQSAFRDPFNMSAGVDQSGHQGQMRGAYGNTPAGLCSANQNMAEQHRQHLTVSGWNMDENNAQANHQMVQESVNVQRGAQEQMYGHHEYM